MDPEKIRQALLLFESGRSPQDVAQILSVSLRTAYNLRRILSLPTKIRQQVEQGEISMAQALRLASELHRTTRTEDRPGKQKENPAAEAMRWWKEAIARARPTAPAMTATVRAQSLASSPLGDDLIALDQAIRAIGQKIRGLSYHARESLAMVLQAYIGRMQEIVREAEHAGTDQR